MWIRNFTVEGHGDFPFDMLRYDKCYPSTGKDASAISFDAERRSYEQYFKKRHVTLTIRCASKSEATIFPSSRWLSFGWQIVNKEPPRKL